MPEAQATAKAPSIKHQPRSQHHYLDVGLGSVILTGRDTGGAYCLLEVSTAPGIAGLVIRIRARTNRIVFSAENWKSSSEIRSLFLRPGDTLLATRDIPHQLRNSGSGENHFLLLFSPSGFEEFVMATAVPAPDNAVAPNRAACRCRSECS